MQNDIDTPEAPKQSDGDTPPDPEQPNVTGSTNSARSTRSTSYFFVESPSFQYVNNADENSFKPTIDLYVNGRYALLCLDKDTADLRSCHQIKDNGHVVFSLNPALMFYINLLEGKANINVHFLVAANATGKVPIDVYGEIAMLDDEIIHRLFSTWLLSTSQIRQLFHTEIKLIIEHYPPDDAFEDHFDVSAVVKQLKNQSQLKNAVFFLGEEHTPVIHEHFGKDTVIAKVHNYGSYDKASSAALFECLSHLGKEDRVVVDVDLDFTMVLGPASLFRGEAVLIKPLIALCRDIKSNHPNVEFKVKTSRLEPLSFFIDAVEVLTSLLEEVLTSLLESDDLRSQHSAMNDMLEFIKQCDYHIVKCLKVLEPLDRDYLSLFNQKLNTVIAQEKELAEFSLLSTEFIEKLRTCMNLLGGLMPPTDEFNLAKLFQEVVGSKLVIDHYSYSRCMSDGRVVDAGKAQCIQWDQRDSPAVVRVFCDDNFHEIEQVRTVCGDNVYAIHFRKPTHPYPEEYQQFNQQVDELLDVMMLASLRTVQDTESFQL